MRVDKYLDRIKFKAKIKINIETLIGLHKCHVLSIPFEDLDIHLNRPILLDLDSLYDKIILRNRGGFCYELNFLLYNLLQEIGFECDIVSSRIYDEDENLGPEFDHMSIIVKLEDKWLIDVGYGDLFIEPIKIVDNHSKKGVFKTYRLNETGESTYLLSESRNGKEFKKRYVFDERPKQIEEFKDQCEFKQISKDSYFVKNKICTIPTVDGRITLRNNEFIERVGDTRTVDEVKSESKYYEILKDRFGMDLLNDTE